MAEEKKSVQAAPEKKEKKAKVGFFKRIANFFKEYRSELKKVSWYPAGKVWHDTGIVVIALAVCGAIIGVLDLAFTKVILWLGMIG